MNDLKTTHHLYFTHLPTLFNHLDVYAWNIMVTTLYNGTNSVF